MRAELNAGYDTNPLLAINPSARRDTTLAVDGPGPGAVTGLVLDAFGALGGDHWLGLALSDDARLYHDGAARHDLSLAALGGLDVRRTRLSVAAQLGRYDASFGADNAWYSAITPRARLSLTDDWSVGAQAQAGVRTYDGGPQDNWDVGGALDVRFRDSHWLATLVLDLNRRQSDAEIAERTQLSPMLSLQRRLGDVTLGIGYAAYVRWFDQGSQDGVEHTVELRAQWSLTQALSLLARGSIGIARGQAEALRYDRAVALLALVITLGSNTNTTRDAIDRTDQGPAQLSGAQSRFAWCGAQARQASVRQVALVGTFNDWSPTAERMQRNDDGCFEITLTLPQGRYRYQFWVDGTLVRPEGAPAYADDGFGGQDAVLIVAD